MSDWDVIGPIETEYIEEEDEEELIDSGFEFATEDSYEEDYYHSPKIACSAPQKFILNKSKRQDRVAYRHRFGDGIRKPFSCQGRDIQDAIDVLQEGDPSYNDQIVFLRESSANDLISDFDRDKRDIVGGAGSKIIKITKVRKGSFKRNGNNIAKLLKNEKLSERTDQDIHHYWDHVSHELLEDGFFVEAKYLNFKEQALNERAKLGIGNSAEMNSLYCFWCFYLREHYNRDMYDEFLQIAREDRSEGSFYGLECYFRFASYGLEKFWNEDVYNDFETTAMIEHYRGNNYGLEKFKAFHLNQKYDFPIPIRAETQAVLDQYPTMKSFREPINKNPSKKKQRINASNDAMAKADAGKNINRANNPKVQTNQNAKQDQKNISDQPKNNQSAPQFAANHKQQPPPPTQQRQQNQNQQKKKPENRRARGGRNASDNRREKDEMPKPAGRGWTFGKLQPSSVPIDSPMRRKW